MHSGITEELARAKNKAWRIFKWWLQSRSAEDLAKADADEISRQFPPLEPWEISEMVQMRAKTLQRAQAAGKAPPSII